MYDKLLRDSRIFDFVLQVDRDIEAHAGAQRCSHCGDVLHRAYYDRKPRVPFGIELPPEFASRPSFCCRRDGCRRRSTPPMVRFLGRKVYLSIIVVLAAAIAQGATPKRMRALKSELGIEPQTLQRWLCYWQKIFVTSPGWRYQRGNFMPPVDESCLPLSLLQSFGAAAGDWVVGMIRLISHASRWFFNPHPA